MPVRILIVEDEFVTLDLLRDYVEDAGHSVSGDAMTAAEAIDVLDKFETDLAILDINLRGEHNGIWLANEIRENYNIPFIFITANSDAANVRIAAETYPYGYVVKPFTSADVMAAIEVALKQRERELLAQPMKPIAKNSVELYSNEYVFLKDAQNYRKVLVQDILYVQVFKNYIEVSLRNESPVVLRSTLYKFMEILPKAIFRQIHRSFVINTQHIEQIGSDYVLIKEKNIPLGKSYRAEFLDSINYFG